MFTKTFKNLKSKMFWLKLKVKILEIRFKIKYIGKNYYHGRLVRWLIADKKGVSVYCAHCGNIANGVHQGKVLFMKYTIPLCKVHLNKR